MVQKTAKITQNYIEIAKYWHFVVCTKILNLYFSVQIMSKMQKTAKVTQSYIEIAKYWHVVVCTKRLIYILVSK